MEIKIGSFNLGSWQVHNKIVPMIKVCIWNNRRYLGVITGLITEVHCKTCSIINLVEVFWQTGPNAGNKKIVDVNNLVNYDAYKAHIAKELKKLEDTETEAAKVGM